MLPSFWYEASTRKHLCKCFQIYLVFFIWHFECPTLESIKTSTDYPIRIKLVLHDLSTVLPVNLLQAVLGADPHQLAHNLLDPSTIRFHLLDPRSSWCRTVFPAPKQIIAPQKLINLICLLIQYGSLNNVRRFSVHV